MLNEILAVKLHDTHALLTQKRMTNGLQEDELLLLNQATRALQKHFKLVELLLNGAIDANKELDNTEIEIDFDSGDSGACT